MTPVGVGRSGPVLPYRVVAGVVPCRGSWLIVSAKLQGTSIAPEVPQLVPSFIEVLDCKPAFSAVALHAPIGLAELPARGGRACDRQARMLLGPRRGRTIRSSPIRSILDEAGSADAVGIDAITRKLLKNYKEVAGEMAAYLQRTIHEAHPELSFYDLNGDRPLTYSKNTAAGRQERRELLLARMPSIDRVLDSPPVGARTTHLLDAAACLWTARRVVAHAMVRLPEDAEWDEQGLRMEIVR